MDARFKETLINGRWCKYWVKVGRVEFDFSNLYHTTRIAFKIDSPRSTTPPSTIESFLINPHLSRRNFSGAECHTYATFPVHQNTRVK